MPARFFDTVHETAAPQKECSDAKSTLVTRQTVAIAVIAFAGVGLERWYWEMAAQQAEEIGALLYTQDSGLLLVLVFIVLTLVGAWAVDVATPKQNPLAPTARFLRSRQGLQDFYVSHVARRAAAKATSAKDFLKNARSIRLGHAAALATFAVLASGFGIWSAANNYTLADGEGLTHSHLYPPYTQTRYSWSDARRFSLECGSSGGRRKRGQSALRYTVQFNDGSRFRLGHARVVTGTHLDHLSTIQARLPESASISADDKGRYCPGFTELYFQHLNR